MKINISDPPLPAARTAYPTPPFLPLSQGRDSRFCGMRCVGAHELGDGEVHPVEGAHAVTIGQRRLHLVHPRDERVD